MLVIQRTEITLMRLDILLYAYAEAIDYLVRC